VIEPIAPGASEPASARATHSRKALPRRILEEIERFPLVLDAGMGTRLLDAGLDLRIDDPALWCLSHSEEVVAIHRRDVASGARAIVTNTFGANRTWLARFGQVGNLGPINRRAVQLARSAAGSNRFVLGCVGPTAAAQPGAAAEQAAILSSEGVDALLLETFHFPEVETVLEEVHDTLPFPVPLFVSLWEWPENHQLAANRLVERGAAVLGLNCQSGAPAAVAFAERLGKTSRVPLLVKPGTGSRGDTVMSPAELSAVVPTLLAHNVRLIGGCCGTDESHIAAVADCLRIHRVSFRYKTGDTRP
jgi:5-methyltetrahydrofolate--homocysteine methyltransferase